MAIQSYILDINTSYSKARYLVSYKSGTFYKLEQKSGVLDKNRHSNLMKVVPLNEDSISKINDAYKGQITYTPVVKTSHTSLYCSFIDSFLSFYKGRTDIDYDFRAMDGKAVKGIITTLKKTSCDDTEALALWQGILSNWDNIEDFYAKQLELKQINSNLNTLLRQVKHGKHTSYNKKDAYDYADELRRSI